jgi:hypothetical protein
MQTVEKQLKSQEKRSDDVEKQFKSLNENFKKEIK